MMKRVLIFGLLCLPVMLHAQSASSADRLFQDENYAEAQGQYEQLLRQSPKNALYLYRYARCAQILGDDATAVRYFVAAGTKYSLRDFFLGESYWRLWHFDEAEKAGGGRVVVPRGIWCAGEIIIFNQYKHCFTSLCCHIFLHIFLEVCS